MKDVVLKLNAVSYSTPNSKDSASKNSVEILRNISFEFERNKIYGISGESGCGKTTLMKVVSDILKPTNGTIDKYFLKNWEVLAPKPIQVLFQNDGNLLNPNRKVNAMLNEAFALKNKYSKDYSSEIKDLFGQLDLKLELLNKIGSQLSGGEQQRIALARVLIIEPEILILDEPFSSQDIKAQNVILNLIGKIKNDFNLTLLCISHDLQILKYFADDILIMYNGSIIESGNSAELFTNPKNDYTRFLLSAQSLQLSKEEIISFRIKYEQNKRNQDSRIQ